VAAKSRQLRARKWVWAPEGELGFPGARDRMPTSPQAEATAHAGVAGWGLLGGLVFHAIGVSSNDDRLPVMHQPVDHGGGQGVVDVEDRAPVAQGPVDATLYTSTPSHTRSIPPSDGLEECLPAVLKRS